MFSRNKEKGTSLQESQRKEPGLKCEFSALILYWPQPGKGYTDGGYEILLVNKKWKGGQSKILFKSKWYVFIRRAFARMFTEVWFTVRKKVRAT